MIEESSFSSENLSQIVDEEIDIEFEEDDDSNNYREEALIAGEKLYKVKKVQMSDLLHKNIGALISKCKSKPGHRGYGTGILISPDFVLTVAHNIFCQRWKEQHYDIRFYPGQYGLLGQGLQVEKWFFPKIFKTNRRPINDFALLKLKKKVQRQEFIALNSDVQRLKKNQSEATIAIFGYPAKYYKQLRKTGDSESISQRGLIKSGKIIKIDENKQQIIYQISTMKGQSGAPIILIEPERLTIVGIHKGSHYKINQLIGNIGRIISTNLIDIFRKQAEKMGAIMFKVHPQQNQSLKFYGLSAQQNIQKRLKLYKAKRFQEFHNNQVYKSLGALPANRFPINSQHLGASAKQYYQRGLILQKQEKYYEAIKNFSIAVKIHPNYAKAHNGMGVALANIQRTEEAQKSFRRVIQINPNNANAHYNIGVLFSVMNRKKEAQKSFRRAIQIDPTNANVHFGIGVVLTKMKRNLEALNSFKRVIKMDPNNAKAYNNIGCVLKAMKNIEQALKNYKIAIQIDPNYANAHNNIRVLLKDMSQKEQTLESYRTFNV